MPTVAASSPGRRSSFLEGALGFVAVALPFGLAVARAASSGQWRDDLPAVRDLGLVAVGIGGGLSTLLTQALGLLPLGSHTFRAALGSAVALALAAHLLDGLARRVLLAARPDWPRLAALLAAMATLTAALSPTWQREATVGGGAMLAVCSALAFVSLALRVLPLASDPAPDSAFPRSPEGSRKGASPRAWLGLGALLGMTLAESPPAALAAAATVIAWLAARRWTTPKGSPALPPRGSLLRGLAAALAVAALLLAPAALRPLAPRAWVDVGRALSAASFSALDVASVRTTALTAWIREVGLVSLGIALAGALATAARPRPRALVAPLLVLVAADTLFPASAAGVLTADPLTPLRSLAVVALTVSSALGVQVCVTALLAWRVPLSRAGAVLVVVFHLTLVALTSEEAGFVADRSQQLAAEEWADQALGALDPSAAILVRSPAVSWRLWAARLTRGERPDVVVLPIPLLDRGRVAASLLATDPRLEPLLRDFALTGEPGEFALSKVADARALHVELDRSWSKRLVSHLAVDGMWLEFAPQPLGASDRKLSASATLAPFRRVLAAVNEGTLPDASTSSVLASTLRSQALVLTILGEREAAQTFLARIDSLERVDPLGGKAILRAESAAVPVVPSRSAPGAVVAIKK